MAPHFGLPRVSERKKKKKRVDSFTWFEVTVNGGAVVLSILRGAAVSAPVPYLRGAAATSLSIIQIAQTVKDNKADFRRMCEDVATLAVVVYESRQRSEDPDRWPGPGLKDSVDSFLSTLQMISEFAQSQVDRALFVRVMNSVGDGNKIREFRERLAQAMSRFEVSAHLQSYEVLRLMKNTMMENYKNRLNEEEQVAMGQDPTVTVSSHPLPAVPSDSESDKNPQLLRDEELAKALAAHEEQAAKANGQEDLMEKLQQLMSMLENRPEPAMEHFCRDLANIQKFVTQNGPNNSQKATTRHHATTINNTTNYENYGQHADRSGEINNNIPQTMDNWNRPGRYTATTPSDLRNERASEPGPRVKKRPNRRRNESENTREINSHAPKTTNNWPRHGRRSVAASKEPNNFLKPGVDDRAPSSSDGEDEYLPRPGRGPYLQPGRPGCHSAATQSDPRLGSSSSLASSFALSTASDSNSPIIVARAKEAGLPRIKTERPDRRFESIGDINSYAPQTNCNWPWHGHQQSAESKKPNKFLKPGVDDRAASSSVLGSSRSNSAHFLDGEDGYLPRPAGPYLQPNRAGCHSAASQSDSRLFLAASDSNSAIIAARAREAGLLRVKSERPDRRFENTGDINSYPLQTNCNCPQHGRQRSAMSKEPKPGVDDRASSSSDGYLPRSSRGPYLYPGRYPSPTPSDPRLGISSFTFTAAPSSSSPILIEGTRETRIPRVKTEQANRRKNEFDPTRPDFPMDGATPLYIHTMIVNHYPGPQRSRSPGRHTPDAINPGENITPSSSSSSSDEKEQLDDVDPDEDLPQYSMF